MRYLIISLVCAHVFDCQYVRKTKTESCTNPGNITALVLMIILMAHFYNSSRTDTASFYNYITTQYYTSSKLKLKGLVLLLLCKHRPVFNAMGNDPTHKEKVGLF